MNKNKAGSNQPLLSKTAWRLLFGVIFLLLTICMVRPCFQNDTFFVLKLGENLLDNGIVLDDPWAWSANFINTYPHFLLNIVFALLYRAFGFIGIYSFVLVMGYVLALSLYYLIEKVYEHTVGKTDEALYPLAGIFVSVIILTVYPTFIVARAQMVSFPLWLWETWFIICFLNSGKKRYGAAIVLIAWLCALFHATAWYFTFILFIPFFTSVLITKLGTMLSTKNKSISYILQKDRVILSNDTECRNAKKLLIVMLISFATGFLTPTRVCLYSAFSSYSSVAVNYNVEFQPLNLMKMKYVLVVLILFVVLISVFRSSCRLDLLFLFGGTFIMSAMSQRHVGLFIFIGCFALYFVAFSVLKLISPYLKNRLINTGISVIVSLALAVLGFAKNNITPVYFFDSAFVSPEAIDFLEENYDVQSLRLFNNFSYGAYMLFRDVPVFIDSRVNEYTKAFDPSLERDVLDDYLSIISLDNNWHEVVDYYDFDGYFIPKDGSLYEILLQDPSVEPVWENDTMIIFMTV